MAVDYYQVLGVEKDATQKDIKKAFHRKARELHPDVNKADDAEERFKELNEAYDVLGDEKKRSNYDRFGTAGGPGGFGGGGGYQYVDMEDIFGGFSMDDIFSTFFGGAAAGGGAATVRKEGRDMGIGLRITLEEAAAGAQKEVVYDRLAPCDECGGDGLGSDGKVVTCPTCGGAGRVVSTQNTLFGQMQTQRTCPDCRGMGQTIENPCPECEGQGRAPDRERITVDVPAGVRDGQNLRVTGYGEAGMNGAEPGNLIITVRIADHDRFVRDGDDLHTKHSISITQAALGADVEVDGILEGEKVSVEVPAGAQYNQVIRVKGAGMPRRGTDTRGDLHLHLEVIVPRKLTDEQRELMEQLAELFGDDVADRRSAFQKFKDALS